MTDTTQTDATAALTADAQSLLMALQKRWGQWAGENELPRIDLASNARILIALGFNVHVIRFDAADELYAAIDPPGYLGKGADPDPTPAPPRTVAELQAQQAASAATSTPSQPTPPAEGYPIAAQTPAGSPAASPSTSQPAIVDGDQPVPSAFSPAQLSGSPATWQRPEPTSEPSGQ